MTPKPQNLKAIHDLGSQHYDRFTFILEGNPQTKNPTRPKSFSYALVTNDNGDMAVRCLVTQGNHLGKSVDWDKISDNLRIVVAMKLNEAA